MNNITKFTRKFTTKFTSNKLAHLVMGTFSITYIYIYICMQKQKHFDESHMCGVLFTLLLVSEQTERDTLRYVQLRFTIYMCKMTNTVLLLLM